MKRISTSDRIFATVSFCGNTIYNSVVDGMNSIEDVIRLVSRSLRGVASGIVTLVVRNGSQGWSDRRNIRITPPAEGTQFSFSF